MRRREEILEESDGDDTRYHKAWVYQYYLAEVLIREDTTYKDIKELYNIGG